MFLPENICIFYSILCQQIPLNVTHCVVCGPRACFKLCVYSLRPLFLFCLPPLLQNDFRSKWHSSRNWVCPCGKTIQARKILNAWYFVYMSERMSVSLNWDRLCTVCEKEAEEPWREKATDKEEKTEMKWHGGEIFYRSPALSATLYE